MDIRGLDKAEVLVKLYENARVQGMGIFHHDSSFRMDREAAQQLLAHQTKFDYLKGRVMKIDLSGDKVDTYLYNRDNGPNAAENAVALLPQSQSVTQVSP